MRDLKKMLMAASLIVCLSVSLMACGNSEDADTKETTTTEEKVTSKEPETTTEEESTEYVFKGHKYEVHIEYVDFPDKLVIKPGDIVHINDYVTNQSADYDWARGRYLKSILTLTNSDNEWDIRDDLWDKYGEYGNSQVCDIPYADNYSFEYVGAEDVVFQYVENKDEDIALYDVYLDYEYKGEKLELDTERYKDYYYNLLVENGYKLYINDLWPDESSDFDFPRGYHLKMIIESMNLDNYEEIISDLENKYGESGDIAIPYADNYYFEYTGNDKIIFKFIEETWNGDKSYFDVYKLEE